MVLCQINVFLNVAAYYIKGLYKIREYTMIKKTKEKMDGSFLCVSKLSSQFLVKR